MLRRRNFFLCKKDLFAITTNLNEIKIKGQCFCLGQKIFEALPDDGKESNFKE